MLPGMTNKEDFLMKKKVTHHKKSPFLYGLFYYNIIPYTTIFLVLFFFRDFIFKKILELANIRLFPRQLFFWEIVFYSVLFIIWLSCFVRNIKVKNYKRLTGRSLLKDEKKFGKTYQYLMRFHRTCDPHKMDIKKLPIGHWSDFDGIVFCKVKDEFGNYRILAHSPSHKVDGINATVWGRPGCGKSTSIAAPAAINWNKNLRRGGCGLFAISIKGDLLNFLKGKRKHLKVFTPDKAEGSWHFNPLDGIEKMNETERRTLISNLALVVCPDEKGENSDFFVGGARDYFIAISFYLLYLHETGKREGSLKWSEIVKEALQGNAIAVATTIAASDCTVAQDYTNSYIGANEKNCASIYQHLCKCLLPYKQGALLELFDDNVKCIKPADLMKSDIIIDVPLDKYSLYSSAISIITTNFLNYFLSRGDLTSGEKIVPVLYLLDEVFQMQIPGEILARSMSVLRSFGVSIMLLGQSIAQLEGKYGKTMAREIMDLCTYSVVFNAQDPESRKYFQEILGYRKYLKRSTSVSQGSSNSFSYSVTEEKEFIIDAADLGDLSKNIDSNKSKKKQTKKVLVYANGEYVIGEPTPFYE